LSNSVIAECFGRTVRGARRRICISVDECDQRGSLVVISEQLLRERLIVHVLLRDRIARLHFVFPLGLCKKLPVAGCLEGINRTRWDSTKPFSAVRVSECS
jgi:hypothetical protein